MNFHDERLKFSYTGRTADASWQDAVKSIIDPNGLCIADIGCGGGIYAKAWIDLGAESVIGVDSSPTMLSAARESCGDVRGISFQEGDAADTGLPSQSVDVVFARALIHHLSDLQPYLGECIRVLKPGGKIILQDRVPEDISVPGSHEHIRGYFFECFPRLLDIEVGRRRSDEVVQSDIGEAGLQDTRSITLWETRKTYASKAALVEDLRARKGRSILHELIDDEIETLVAFVDGKLGADAAIVEKDRWTIWSAVKR